MTENESTYEMMWDCKFCGQKKLLGLSHRHCPNCGGPQDPNARYFPPDAERVAVKDHPFVGADLSCKSCNQLMSRAVKCCPHCGAPVAAGMEIALRSDVVVPDPTAPPVVRSNEKSAGGRGWIGIVLGVVALLIVGACVMIFWKREGVFVVSGKSWERHIAIEQLQDSRTSAWCDSAPAGGKELARHKEARGTNKVEDGQTCQTRKKDNGNGTYKEVKECTPKYKDVPVMADKCDYAVTQWQTEKTLTESGADDAPRWPQVALARAGTCVGCEREGAHDEKYTVRFADSKTNAPASCDVNATDFASYAKGARYKGKVRVATGGVDCTNLIKD